MESILILVLAMWKVVSSFWAVYADSMAAHPYSTLGLTVLFVAFVIVPATMKNRTY